MEEEVGNAALAQVLRNRRLQERTEVVLPANFGASLNPEDAAQGPLASAFSVVRLCPLVSPSFVVIGLEIMYTTCLITYIPDLNDCY